MSEKYLPGGFISTKEGEAIGEPLIDFVECQLLVVRLNDRLYNTSRQQRASKR